MVITRAILTPFRLPLQWPLATAHGVTRVRDGVLLCLESDAGLRGFGETMPLPGFGLESLQRARAALVAAVPALLGRDPRDLDTALEIATRATRNAPGSRAALDVALHDLAARARGLSVAALLGGSARSQVEVGALLAAKTPRDAAAAARAAVALGYRTLKLKVAATTLDRDVARAMGVRDAVGPDVALRLDANGGWDEATARDALAKLEPAAPEFVEQPVPARAWDALARLRGASRIPIAADESACDAAGVQALLARDAADVLIVKPAVLGGLREACRIISAARAAGVDVVVTGFLDSAIGDAAALELAAARGGDTRAAGLGSQSLLAADLAASMPPHAGARSRNGLPGLGVVPDAARLAAASSGTAWERR